MNILRYVDYKNKKELVLEFSEFGEAKQAALSFSKFINPDGNTKRPSSVCGPIAHMNIYSDLYEDFAVMLSVPTSKKSESDTLPTESGPMPNFEGVSKVEFEHIEVKMVHKKEVKTPSLFEIPKRPTKGLCSDCGSVNGKNPGIFKYRIVDIETKGVIFEKIISGNCTNNLAELLGAVHTIGYNKANNLNLPVYTDSQTALSWIRKKNIKTKHIVTDNELQNELDVALKYIKTLSKAEHPILWQTVTWGQIDADYGAK